MRTKTCLTCDTWLVPFRCLLAFLAHDRHSLVSHCVLSVRQIGLFLYLFCCVLPLLMQYCLFIQCCFFIRLLFEILNVLFLQFSAWDTNLQNRNVITSEEFAWVDRKPFGIHTVHVGITILHAMIAISSANIFV